MIAALRRGPNGITAYEGTPAEFQINDLPPGGTSCDAELDSFLPQTMPWTTRTAQDFMNAGFPGCRLHHRPDQAGFDYVPSRLTICEESTDVTFEFSSNLSDCEPGQFLLAEDDGSETCSGLVEDTYTVTQIPGDLPSGCIFSVIYCNAVDSEGHLVAGPVTINLQPGEDVTCVFVNEVPS